MSKELEEFEEMYNWIYCNTGTTYEDDVKLDKIRKNVKSALQRLESIDNANPSEALESLEIMRCNLPHYYVKEYNTVKQELLKAQELEKVLEILKEKRVDLSYLRCCIEDNQSVERYNEYIRNKTMEYDHEVELTQEEFDLLKRWLG